MAGLIVFLPLFAAIIVGLNTRGISAQKAQFITSIATSLSAILSWVLFYDVAIQGNSQIIQIANWVTSGDLSFSWALRIDVLTAVMLIVVTTVSALVHIYSIGYMSHDKHPQRFMAYLSLFTFFMLMLVTSDNFAQLFLGWEGVGLCSYLLIGFWYHKESANQAAMKAFIVNRVGDFGFALGIFAIFYVFGTIQFSEVFEKAHLFADEERVLNFLGMDIQILTLICVLLFIGAMGKSAQLGLHTWLPDAMEGPTPVSALIHAATMVTAGVFMVARCSPLFEHSETALALVTVVGTCTCLFAATIAITQNDIKRVIAYSTCSQLGYMFFACGVSAYAAGIFHLMTHGFFKALLFLGAGSVIHAMSDEQDMRNMGGIWQKIPLTFAMMMIGTLAITGFPLLSGYYSKDLVLETAYAAGRGGNPYGAFAFWVGILAAMLTAFYSWRLIFMTFFGKCRASKKVQSHIHESPKVMTIPLLVLAVGALGAGVFFSQTLHIGDMAFWQGSITVFKEDYPLHGNHEVTGNILEAAHHVPDWVKMLPFGVGLIGLLLAVLFYVLAPQFPAMLAKTFAPLYNFLLNKWYIDELYDMLFVRPAKRLGYLLWQIGDVGFIDRFGPNGLSLLSVKLGQKFNKLQSGYVYHYAFVMLIGVVGIVTWLIF